MHPTYFEPFLYGLVFKVFPRKVFVISHNVALTLSDNKGLPRRRRLPSQGVVSGMLPSQGTSVPNANASRYESI